MDFCTEQAGEAQRVFGNLENVRLEKFEIKKGSKSVSPLPHKACSAGRRHKKGELRSVHLLQLVVGRDAGSVP